MNILFISYWGVNEVLCHSTVLPHLELLANDERVDNIFFLTIERHATRSQTLEKPIQKVQHSAIISEKKKSVFLTKISDVSKTKKLLTRTVAENRIDFVIGRSVLAGIFCNFLYEKFKIPFAVESFEPHSKYMLAGNVWKWYDPRYVFQKKSEKKQLKNAFKIMSVSENYASELKQNNPDKNIVAVPCATNFNYFKPNLSVREQLRESLCIKDNEIIGIYVGKFGGIYHNLENFIARCKELKSHFKNQGIAYRSILLSPQHEELKVNQELIELRTITKFVAHNEVSSYLNAADFAFCLQLSSSVSHCFSPIKNGEYWACGLPILMGENIGDDSAIIKTNSVGYILDFTSPIGTNSFSILKSIILNDVTSQKCIQTAEIHRNFQTVFDSYEEILNENYKT